MRSTPAIDFETFATLTNRARKTDPERIARVGLDFIDSALKIRRGGDGLYGDIDQPVTRPAEAIGAWIKNLQHEAHNDPSSFYRRAEMREAVVAAAEEIDTASRLVPTTTVQRLQNALYSDALEEIIGSSGHAPTSTLPWIIVGALGGVILGILLAKK